jgi:membrane protein YdbS with pleckstrin-like domain
MSRGAEVFAEPGLAWNRVSPRLARARRLLLVVPAVVVVAGLAVLAHLTRGPVGRGVWVAPVIALLVAGWAWWALGRNAASRGWTEREQDLLVRRGFLFRSLTVVPYGRMQVVEVEAGPVAGAFGFATVTLVTASAHTDARIPGIPAQAARDLRDRLTARGETSAAGL